MRESGAFIGFVGLSSSGFSAPFAPCVEIGWRLVPAVWGQGLATEGARAAIRWAGADVTPTRAELVSFTTTANASSRRAMEKIGLRHDPTADFDHPLLPDWSGRRHVLYRSPSSELLDLARTGVIGGRKSGIEQVRTLVSVATNDPTFPGQRSRSAPNASPEILRFLLIGVANMCTTLVG